MSAPIINCPCCNASVEKKAASFREHYGANSTTCDISALTAERLALFVKDNGFGPCACGRVYSITKGTGLIDGSHLKTCASRRAGAGAEAPAPVQRKYELCGGKLTGRFVDEEVSQAKQQMQEQGPRREEEDEGDDGDEMDDVTRGGDRPATRGATRAARLREEAIATAVMRFAEALDGVSAERATWEARPVSASAETEDPGATGVSEEVQEEARAALEAIGDAAMRKVHPNAVRQVEVDARNPDVVNIERALLRASAEFRAGEFMKRLDSKGMADVTRDAVLGGLQSNYNALYNETVEEIYADLVRSQFFEEDAAELLDQILRLGLTLKTRELMAKVVYTLGERLTQEKRAELRAQAERMAEEERNMRIEATYSRLMGANSTGIAPATEELFMRACARLKADKAPGPVDNLSSNDFINMVDADANTRLPVFRIINHILAGTVHEVKGLWASLSAVNIFALVKDTENEGNVRGISVGSMFIKTAALCMLLRHAPEMRKATAGNMGNGQPGGADAFAHMGNQFVGSAQTATLRVDVQRAFDQCGVEHIMEGVRELKLSDELIEFAYLWYSIPCEGRVSDASRRLRLIIHIMEGVRQGDAMSMALYGIGIEVVLRKAREAAGERCVISNLADDVLANDAPLPVAIAAYTLADQLPKMLANKMNAEKSSIFVQTEEMEIKMREALAERHDYMCAREGGYEGPDLRGIKIVKDGLIVAGVPVGTPEFVDSEITKIVSAAEALGNKLLDCTNPKMTGRAPTLSVQMAVECTRLCILPRINHVLRAHTPAVTIKFAWKFDIDVDALMRKLHGMPCRRVVMGESRIVAEHIGCNEEGDASVQINAVSEAELSWGRVYAGRNQGMGFFKTETTCCAAYMGAIALIAPALHAAYGCRSQLDSEDKARDLDSLHLLPIPHDYSQLVQSQYGYYKKLAEKTGCRDGFRDMQEINKTLSRAAIVDACREGVLCWGKQRLVSRAHKMIKTAQLLMDIVQAHGASGIYDQRVNYTETCVDSLQGDMSDEAAARNRSLAHLRAFTATTRDRRNRFSDREWVLAVRLALGIPILSHVQECPSCGERMSVTAAHMLSCQTGRGMRKGAHDIIIKNVAATLSECVKKGKYAIPVVVETEKCEGALALHLDPTWMHAPRKAAMVQNLVGGSFNALVGEDEVEQLGDYELAGEAAEGGAEGGSGAARRSSGAKRGRGGRSVSGVSASSASSQRAADIRADLRVRRCIDSPELNPRAARANTETVDLRVTSPLSASYIKKAATETGHAAKLAEGVKTAHYRKHYEDGGNVAPLVIETFGFMAPDSEEALMRLVMLASGLPKTTDIKSLKKKAKSDSDARATYMRVRANLLKVRNTISCSLWRTNAVALDAKLREANAQRGLSLSHPMEWEGDIWPEGAGAAWEAVSGQQGEACIFDNRGEGYRVSAIDLEAEGMGYDITSLETAERQIARAGEAAAAAEGEVAAAREAELDELMEAQLLEGARGEGMDHDEEQPELELWDLSA